MKPCGHWSLQVHGLDTLHLLALYLVVVTFIILLLLHIIYYMLYI